MREMKRKGEKREKKKKMGKNPRQLAHVTDTPAVKLRLVIEDLQHFWRVIGGGVGSNRIVCSLQILFRSRVEEQGVQRALYLS